MEFTPQQVVALLLWILWCSLHSFLIAVPVTDFLKEHFGRWFRYYRLVYNVVALITLAPVALYSISAETAPIFRWEGALAVLRYALASAAVSLFIAGARIYRLSKVVGIDQIRTGKTPRPLTERGALSTTGIHSLIRHPWYAGALLIVWTREIGPAGLSANIVLSLYLIIGAFLEEAKLVMELGDAYREYQKRVSMLFPWKWLKMKWTASRKTHLFAYGTLMCEDIMRQVAGCLPAARPGILKDHTRRRVRNQDYPGLLQREGDRVDGIVYLDLPVTIWERLDRFEGEMYLRRPVTIELNGGDRLTAETYIVNPAFIDRLEEAEWNFTEFRMCGKSKFQAGYEGFDALK